MHVLGIDSSTYTALVSIGESFPLDKVTSRLLHFDNKKDWDRVQSIAVGTANFLDEVSGTYGLPEVVCIEGYTTHRASNIALLVSIGTVIRQVLHSRGLQWYSIPPSTLKHWVCGKGNAKKPEMMAKVHERWGYKTSSDDIADAYALARVAEEIRLHGPEHLKGALRCN
jgi:crossover junction endodeoxyribonuclease RuvC